MPNYPYPELPRHVVDAHGIQTSYYLSGKPNGRPVIMLHGMSTSADSFRETMHELGEEMWLIAPDIPGFGYSDNTNPYTFPHLVEWLAAFQDVLELPSSALIGHSFGGTLATTFALAYPEDVTELLLVAPALLAAANFPEFAKKVGVSLGLIDLGSAVSQSKIWVKRQIKSPFYDADTQDDSVWDRRLRDYDLSRASADVLKASAFHDLRPQLNEVTHPVCIVWGENDPVVPATDGEQLREMFPNADLHTLAECGHVPVLEKQTEFQGIAKSFLNGGSK
jgi:pimeloyl-ACP methyl ester carboxylesterase